MVVKTLPCFGGFIACMDAHCLADLVNMFWFSIASGPY